MDAKQSPKPEELFANLEAEAVSAVDDFIKELEAKEKDLHITADLTIEIAESDVDESSVPDFVQQDLSAPSSEHPAATPGAKPSVGLKTRVYELENEVETLNERIRGLRIERNEIQEKSDRRLKDFESYKYRTDRERRGAFIDQITNLASQMLPVLDNLDRALDSVRKDSLAADAEFQQFYDGIALVNNQVSEVFAEMGVQPIPTVGEEFDPNLHEAVAVETREGVGPNMVVEEMLRGYRIGNRIIRHSMVKVTAAGGARKPAPAPPTPQILADDEPSAPDARAADLV